MITSRVEVDLYSGRPNPAWDLTTEASKSLLERCEDLPVVSGITRGADTAQGLGYRGLKVDVLREDQVQQLLIGGGRVVVEVPGSHERYQLQDFKRQLEKWLLETGREHLAPDLYQYWQVQAAS